MQGVAGGTLLERTDETPRMPDLQLLRIPDETRSLRNVRAHALRNL